MHTFGIHYLRPETMQLNQVIPEFLAAAACPLCSKPVSAHIQFAKYPGNIQMVKNALERFNAEARTPESMDLIVKDVWPKAGGPVVPADIPESARRAFLQAERNYLQNGNEDAAASMYRKALEMALKAKYPDATGSLAKRIDDLVKMNAVPVDIGNWAHEIRIVGNDSVHEVDSIERVELEAMRGFTDAVLRYLFTLPAQVARRNVST